MLEPGACVVWGDGVEGGWQGVLDGGDGPWRDGAQAALQLGPGQLDRVQVWRVGWQVSMGETGASECCPDCRGAVRGEVVHGDDRFGTAAQGRDQHLLDEGQKYGGAGGGSDGHDCDHAVAGNGAEDGQPPPMPAWDAADGALPLRRPGMAAGQTGVEPTLIEEDEAVGVDLTHDLVPPGSPGGDDVGPLLLARV